MQRLNLLQTWLTDQFPGRSFEIHPTSTDASFRRYFRITLADGTPSLIVMDAPPEQENCRPWIETATLFRSLGIHVPEVFSQSLPLGFLLITDFGDTTYLKILQNPNLSLHDAAHYYADALGALAALQQASHSGVLPDYTHAHLMRELMLFPEWYVAHHKKTTLSDEELNSLLACFEQIIQVNLAEPRVFVHRDFHSRNLMLPPDGPRPGIIDFQDAVYGPMTYDLVSLFKDAYIRWDEEFTLDLLARYWETARDLGLPVRADFAEFHHDYEWMGIQRHMKILGVFARLYYRDGKDAYLNDIPLVLRYLREACLRYREMKPVLKLLDRLETTETAIGYTF